ncbi:hypothetical protein [Bacillus cereus]|jgi:hypothetical protein|uniref:hypothetical protein n=1 Tax=Bacillus cereus TaxID=1396 RepID=UPI000BF2AC27|nr:hypothetical protein [Bacillus cereus]PEX92935.1 hypothetical protein CN450_03765 [Bacillus cereus]
MFEIGDMVKVVRENQSGEIGEHNIDEGTIGKIVNVFVDEEFADGVCVTNFEVTFDEEPDNIYFEAGALILAE